MLEIMKCDEFTDVRQTEVSTVCLPAFSRKDAERARRLHRSLPGYSETPLLSLKDMASRQGVGAIFVKDESRRFGLNAFKGLGGSYSMFRVLCRKLGLNEETTDYETFLRQDIRSRCRKIEFVTATDGNHGKGISWAAALFGCRAHVFLPAGSLEERRKAIEDAGAAAAEITGGNYDQTVEYASRLAEQNGWVLLQDTSRDDYTQYPKWIIEGYLTMALEAEKQMQGKRPTHIFLQAGVGAMAGGIESYFINECKGRKPEITIVEPKTAACIGQSVLAGDGNMHSIAGNPVTSMAGLNCGTPCGIVWPVLRDCTSHFCACEDSVTEEGMRAYAYPVGMDPAVISGQSGAVTYGLLLKILESDALRARFRISGDSVILLINTEGNTDPEGYDRVVIGFEG